jgi:two-component system sensor histidine kinase CiaH
MSIAQNLHFWGDESRIKQLAVILLDNAVKFTPSGGCISFTLGSSKAGIVMTVSDTGIGIDKVDIGKIFQRFYRADKARSNEAGGTGLGLSIASWIVKEHHGTINVESEHGKGSTFKIALPHDTK